MIKQCTYKYEILEEGKLMELETRNNVYRRVGSEDCLGRRIGKLAGNGSALCLDCMVINLMDIYISQSHQTKHLRPLCLIMYIIPQFLKETLR